MNMRKIYGSVQCGNNLPCPCKPKITDFEVARCIEKEVGGLQIPMQDVRGVDVLETSQQLQERMLVTKEGMCNVLLFDR